MRKGERLKQQNYQDGERLPQKSGVSITRNRWETYCCSFYSIHTYTRIFSGRPWLLKSEANFLTDAMELRSNSIASTLAEGFSLTIASWTFLPAVILRTAIITWTPRSARTRAVSVPMPLDAPVITNGQWEQQYSMQYTHKEYHLERNKH